jgi:adenylosuccinate lyase
VTDQINPHDDFVVWAGFLNEFVRMVEDMCTEIWEDSGKDVWLDPEHAERMLFVKPDEGQSGSSAMPQKVQVINIENARGTAQELQGMTATLVTNMSVNRQQRELSD